jgi:formate dehydrogenase
MAVGTVAAGRIGTAVLRRLKPFDVKLHYTDRHRLPASVEQELSATFHPSAESLVRVCDVVTINAPLHPETEHLFDDALIAKMKRGAYLVNTARGKICDRDAVVRALESGQLAGYAGDVWFPQPAPKDHPWRTMPHHGMTPHVSGTSLSAQARYAAGVREILECWFEGRPIREEYLIVAVGKLSGSGAHSYSACDVTGGSEEATRFKRCRGKPSSTLLCRRRMRLVSPRQRRVGSIFGVSREELTTELRPPGTCVVMRDSVAESNRRRRPGNVVLPCSRGGRSTGTPLM